MAFTITMSLIVTLTIIFLYTIQLTVGTMDNQNNYNVSVVSNHINDLGEGPFYESDSDTLYYVDAFKGTVVRQPINGSFHERHALGNEIVSLIIPYSSGNSTFLITVGSKVAKYNWETRNVEILSTLSGNISFYERFNDGKCDFLGRFFVGSVVQTIGENTQLIKGGGSIYRLNGDRLVKVAEGFTLSNGMDWSIDGESFYFNDSEDRKIYAFRFHKSTGELSNKRILVDFNNNPNFKSNEYPDGLVVDASDYIWTALYGGGRLVKIDPKSGKIKMSISVPASKVTSLAFGGALLDKIYVTSSRTESEPDSGKIYSITSEKVELRGKGLANKFIDS